MTKKVPPLTEDSEKFQVVLVDIKKAALEKKIHCVERPLDDDLEYVALSYRWGELQETVIDTQVGYRAVIKSFALEDFYYLCATMRMESDLKDLEYVWVDAICVDQTNHKRRKATIYHMSTIYHRARYILAVPDLHMAYLRTVSTMNEDTLLHSWCYRKDIYHLVHGNSAQLDRIEDDWLTKFKVPADPHLRDWLKTATDCFADHFMNNREHHRYYNSEDILDHFYQPSQKKPQLLPGIHCHQADCPLDFVGKSWVPASKLALMDDRCDTLPWKQLVQGRSQSIRRSMIFMADLIKDWSTRVWVISEYNIAKTKNNMKYWFIQLTPGYLSFLNSQPNCGDPEFRFFKHDFADVDFANTIREKCPNYTPIIRLKSNLSGPVYLTFHKTLLEQLNEQSLFEMLLKSKASKNEDRFYAIFPLMDEYKTLLDNKTEVDKWKIDTLDLLKLKLYELLTTKDKLNLLFLSAHGDPASLGQTLPSFATSSILWIDHPMDYFPLPDSNFDTTITLCQSEYLHVKPKEFYVYHTKNDQPTRPFTKHSLDSIVCIPSLTQVAMKSHEGVIHWDQYVMVLIGNFEHNIWVLEPQHRYSVYAPFFIKWKRYTNPTTGFHIY